MSYVQKWLSVFGNVEADLETAEEIKDVSLLKSNIIGGSYDE
jgi:hypothetical protein